MELYRVLIKTKICPIEISRGDRTEIEEGLKNIKDLLNIHIYITDTHGKFAGVKDFNETKIRWEKQ